MSVQYCSLNCGETNLVEPSRDAGKESLVDTYGLIQPPPNSLQFFADATVSKHRMQIESKVPS